MKWIPLLLAIPSMLVCGAALADEQAKVRVPRIAGAYVPVCKPAPDVFPGPDAATLVEGRTYDDWVPNDHCFVRDGSGRWHAFGITHPVTPTDHLIVCGVHDVRISTSRDFKSWTEHGPILKMKEGIDPESPSVVRHNGTFYLFVCGWDGVWDRKDVQGAYQHKTYVYQSDDPRKFALENEVAVLDAHAPEIFQDAAGDWFISSVEWPHRGVSIAKLVWE